MKTFKSEACKFLINPWLISIMAFHLVITAYILKSQSVERFSNYKSACLNVTMILLLVEVVISAIYIGNEFKNHELRTSVISNPNRINFLISKGSVILAFLLLQWIFLNLVVYMVNPTMFSETELFSKRFLLNLLSIIEIVVINVGITILFESKFFSIGILCSFYLGLGDLLLQFSDKAKYLIGNLDKNLFSFNYNPAYLPIKEALMIQGAVAILISSAVIFKLKNKSIR